MDQHSCETHIYSIKRRENKNVVLVLVESRYSWLNPKNMNSEKSKFIVGMDQELIWLINVSIYVNT